MSVRPTHSELADSHDEAIANGEHLFQRMGMRIGDVVDGRLAVEQDLSGSVVNIRGALQGGLIGVLADVAAGMLAWKTVCDAQSGYSTATTDMNVHYLAPITVGPARAEARVVRAGKKSAVLQVDITDEGQDSRLAAIATVAFTVLPPKPSQ